MKSKYSDAFARKMWLLYFNRVLWKNNLVSQKEYRSMQQKINSIYG